MRLLITTDTVGGVWSFGLELAEGLLQAGDSVALVSLGSAASPRQQAACEALRARWRDNFEFSDTAISLEWMQQNDGCLDQGRAALLRIARAFGAEVLHSNQYCYGAAELGLPVVVTAHSDVFSWARACSRHLEPSAWLSRYRGLVQQGLQEASAVAAPTRWMLLALQQEFAVPVMRRVISNGVDLRPQPCGTRQLSAVTAGRLWDPGKGLAVFHALESPMPIAIAGEEWNSDAAADVPPGALMHGALSREGLLQLFGESAVYVCASLYEPFGLAALEAALCGCAVVARDLPSLREVWGGAAVYFRTAGELSQLLTGLYGDRATLQAAQSRALRRARRYTRERMVKAYRALYGRAAAGEQVRVA